MKIKDLKPGMHVGVSRNRDWERWGGVDRYLVLDDALWASRTQKEQWGDRYRPTVTIEIPGVGSFKTWHEKQGDRDRYGDRGVLVVRLHNDTGEPLVLNGAQEPRVEIKPLANVKGTWEETQAILERVRRAREEANRRGAEEAAKAADRLESARARLAELVPTGFSEKWSGLYPADSSSRWEIDAKALEALLDVAEGTVTGRA